MSNNIDSKESKDSSSTHSTFVPKCLSDSDQSLTRTTSPSSASGKGTSSKATKSKPLVNDKQKRKEKSQTKLTDADADPEKKKKKSGSSDEKSSKTEKSVVKENTEWEKFGKFPALKTHRNPAFQEVQYHIPVSRSWNEEKVEALCEFTSADLKSLKVPYSDNEHPYCAGLRSLSEAYALSAVIADVKDADCKEPMILDVGGSARRHFSLQRSYVWSCIPQFDARDMIRQFSLPGKNHCKHKWQDCDCLLKPNLREIASISVHSLYYIPPADMLVRMLKQIKPVHYAVVHFYPDNKGTIMKGEMEYIKDKGQIWVKAKGNLTWYNHNDCDWMLEGHYSDANGTLEWDIARRFDDVYVLRFVATKEIYNKPTPPPGVIGNGYSNRAAPIPTPPKAVVVSEIPKYLEIWNQCYNPSVEINSKNYKNFLHRVALKANAADLNKEKCIQFCSHKWNSQGVTLSSVSDQLETVAEEHHKRLNLINTKIDIGKVLLLVMVIVTTVFMISTGATFHAGEIPSYSMLGAYSIMLCLSVVAFYYHKFSKVLKNNMFKIDHVLPTYNLSMFTTWNAMVMDYCCQLPDRPSDPTKLISIKYPKDHDLECERKPAAKAMIYHPDYTPYFPAKCPHNLVHCIKNKLLYEIPNAGEYKFPIHPILLKVAAQIKNTLVPLTKEEYLSRFPKPKEERLRREFEESKFDPIERWNDSSVFCKFEGYPEPKYPRPVVSARVEFNYSTGRWLVPLAEAFAEMLPDNIMFPLHGDAVAIGKFHEINSTNANLSDIDFSAFDSSQRKAILAMIGLFMLLCGIPRKIVDRELADIEFIKVKTRNGLKIVMKSIRCSGRSATLFGNSFVTINTVLHVFPELKALLVKGDDSVVYTNKQVVINVQEKISIFLQNGLVAKLRNVSIYDVEFCSSIFIPCEEGVVLVGKPGKLMAKTFWCKDLHFGDLEMQQRFASILKGMQKSVACVPGFNGVLNNPAYRRWFSSVEAHRDEYNEYADIQYTPNSETLFYMTQRYNLEADHLLELYNELSNGFPIKLSSLASQVMIEKDWGPANDGLHLREHFYLFKEWKIVLVEVTIEELLRYLLPLSFTLFIGIFESLVRKDYTHLLVHVLLLLLSYIHPLIALIIHFLLNCRAGPKFSLRSNLNMPKKRNSQQPKKKVAKKTKKSKSNVDSLTKSLAMMVADPCNASLTHGLFGTEAGILGKYKSTVIPASANTYGYIAWFPTMSSDPNVGVNQTINCVYWSAGLAGTSPVNTGAAPLGTGGTALDQLTVGASSFTFSSACQDFRTLSSCIRMVYTGSTSNCQGRVALLDNVPAKAIFDGQSVDRLFSIAGETARLSLDVTEVVLRPSRDADDFRDKTSFVFQRGGAGNATLMGSYALYEPPTALVIAWSGVPSNTLAFDFIQAIEWRAAPLNNYVEPVPRQISTVSLSERVNKYLDDRMPGWTTRVVDAGMNYAMKRLGQGMANLSNRVLGGPPQRLRVMN